MSATTALFLGYSVLLAIGVYTIIGSVTLVGLALIVSRKAPTPERMKPSAKPEPVH